MNAPKEGSVMNIVDTCNPEEFAKHFVTQALILAKRNGPQEFMAWFSGAIVGNVIGNLPDKYWNECLDIKPCGQIGCDCEIMREKAMRLFAIIRTDFQDNCQVKSLTG
jgi:hypothetical protein